MKLRKDWPDNYQHFQYLKVEGVIMIKSIEISNNKKIQEILADNKFLKIHKRVIFLGKFNKIWIFLKREYVVL